MGEYVYELIRKLKETKNYLDEKSVFERNALKLELKRLGYTITGKRIKK